MILLNYFPKKNNYDENFYVNFLDIPYSLDDDFFQRAQILRNKLLKFRHDYFEIVHLKTDFNLSGLESRLKQIILPILSIVDDKDMQEMIIEFLRNKQDNMKEERLNSLF